MPLPIYTPAAQNPFDSESLARRELRRDRLFAHLTQEQQEFFIASALAIGREQAARFAGEEPDALAAALGVRVVELAGENVVAGASVFAEYDGGTRCITLYRAGIASLAAQFTPSLPTAEASRLARNLLLAHELFHHLEATCLPPGLLSVPLVEIPVCGGLWRVKRRVGRCREIAAHGFAGALCDNRRRASLPHRITQPCSL